jgi:hypothetical protein
LPHHLLRVLRPAYAASQLGYDGRRRLARHQLLGIPVAVQNAVEELSPTHRLLAQFRPDDVQLPPLGESTVQFWIKPHDLAERRFHQSIATIEST